VFSMEIGDRPRFSSESAVFAHVEDSEDEDVVFGYFVANFVIVHQNAANFAGLEFGKPGSQTRVDGDAFGARDQVANDASRSGNINRLQKFVEANEIRAGSACPPESHDYRRARRLGLARPSAQASISA